MGGKSKVNTFSLCGEGGETVYTVLLLVTVEEGRTIRVWFLHSCIPRPSLVICSFVLGSPHSSLSLFLGPILWPLLIPCSCLAVYLFPFSAIWEPSLRGKGAMTTLDSSGFTGASWGSGVPLSALCQDAFMEGDKSLWNDKV